MRKNRQTARRTTVRTTLLCALLAGAAACRQPEHPPGVSDEQFIEVMVALRHAARDAGNDVGEYNASRERILTGHGITTEQLGAFVSGHAADPDHLADVWREVVERLSAARVE